MPKNQRPDQKAVTLPRYGIKRMWPNCSGPITCHGCGQPINTDDYMGDCITCGELFCETCITNGTFEKHVFDKPCDITEDEEDE